MASLARPSAASPRVTSEGRKTVRDSLVVTLGGQLERVLGTFTALALRWWLDPAQLGVYTGLRLYLDNTNRTSLGIGLGAVQEIPILRAEGREEEARRIADVAYTTNSLTCLLYAVALVFWACVRQPWLADDPLADEWTWGLVATAGLVLIKRYESFLIAVLRAHQEFVLTTKLDVVEALVSVVAMGLGVCWAGFWGLMVAVGVILGIKIAYLHASHPFRFRWCWEPSVALRLLWLGLPILANTAAFGAVLNLDRALILWLVPDGTRAAGLYTIALMGTSWSLDLAGRIVLVLYTSFQTTLGRTRDPVKVARQALRATEAQAPVLAAGSAIAFLVGPTFLGTLMPKYVEGLPALRPLLGGTLLLGLAWPARQMLIAVERPYRLCLATLVGLALTAMAGTIGADRAGIVGVAWGMTVGYGAVYWFTSAAAFVRPLGWRAWLAHQARLGLTLGIFLAGALIAERLPLPPLSTLAALIGRCTFLAAWLLPLLVAWGWAHDWGGLWKRRTA